MASTDEPPAARSRATIVPAGEGALLVRLGRRITPAAHQRVLELLAALDAAPPPGPRDLVPAYASVLVHYDPLVADRAMVETAIRAALATAAPVGVGVRGARPGRVVRIGVRYGGEDGPDLADVARMVGLAPDEVVRRHTRGRYRVYFLGFLAGFPYLGGLPTALAVPRLATPRPRVPAGSVGLAGSQTGIYSVASPGGWRLIGRTPDALFDPAADPPALLRPGDAVRFYALGGDEERRHNEETEDTEGQRGYESTAEVAQNAERRTETSPPIPLPRGEGSRREGRDGAHLNGAQAEGNGVAALRVERPGPLATVQDLGRWGYARYGVSAAGAADADAQRLGNALLGNPPGAAVVELTLGGAAFTALASCAVVLTGAPCPARVAGRPLGMGTIAALTPGETLVLDRPLAGVRTYLGVAGGVAVPAVLGSRATDVRAGLGGLAGRPLRAGDVIPVGPPSADPATLAGRRAPPDPERRMPADGVWTLRVLPGPHAASTRRATVAAGTPAGNLAALLAGAYRVDPRSDRAGVRLARRGPEGAARPEGGETISEGVPRGAVQVPPDSDPILLLADHQTTGGYRVPAVVIAADHWRIAQLRPGVPVRFAMTTPEEAIAALRARRAWLEGLGSGMEDAGAPDAALLARGFAEWSEEDDGDA
ncbi:MAG TPA: 5-oxoprolinase subunit PxpB [Ktedonobacterales bacterium]